MDTPSAKHFDGVKHVVDHWRMLQITQVIQRISTRQLPGNGWYHALCALKEIRGRAVATSAEAAAELDDQSPMPRGQVGQVAAVVGHGPADPMQLYRINFFITERLADVTSRLYLASADDLQQELFTLLTQYSAVWTQVIRTPVINACCALLSTSNPAYDDVIVFRNMGEIYFINPKTGGPTHLFTMSQLRRLLLAPHHVHVVVAR